MRQEGSFKIKEHKKNEPRAETVQVETEANLDAKWVMVFFFEGMNLHRRFSDLIFKGSNLIWGRGRRSGTTGEMQITFIKSAHSLRPKEMAAATAAPAVGGTGSRCLETVEI